MRNTHFYPLMIGSWLYYWFVFCCCFVGFFFVSGKTNFHSSLERQFNYCHFSIHPCQVFLGTSVWVLIFIVGIVNCFLAVNYLKLTIWIFLMFHLICRTRFLCWKYLCFLIFQPFFILTHLLMVFMAAVKLPIFHQWNADIRWLHK